MDPLLTSPCARGISASMHVAGPTLQRFTEANSKSMCITEPINS